VATKVLKLSMTNLELYQQN